MKLKSPTRHALNVAILVWVGSMIALAVAGLATDVWRLSDLWGQAGATFLGEFGLIAVVSTFLFVGGPVFLWSRWEFIAPIIGLACYTAYWAYFGVTTAAGVSALYVGVMYGMYAFVGLGGLAIIEWGLRTVRLQREAHVDR